MAGFVYLAGAGPGDPKLLTLRALELMRSAEVVAYDELISPEILAMIPAKTELLAVGRRHGQGQAEYRLHPLVLERAWAGRTVLRLKSGDPFIFGRGAEEAEELKEAGIPFEIVPGVSAALGAAAYAGIPLTDRRYASQVTLATGHSAEVDEGARRPTLVLYMAAHRLAENLERLIAQGRAPSTPAAYIAAATTPNQRVISGTLADLASRVARERRSDPALVIVGDVVALRERIGWFERMPLRGRRVLVGRARPGRSQIAARLRAIGAEVMESPRVVVMELDDYSILDSALAQVGRFDAIAFGCAAGVHASARRLDRMNLKLDWLSGTAVIAVGREAHEAMQAVGISPAVNLDGACRDALSGSSPDLACKRLLLIVAAQGRPNLRAELAALGASVEAAPAYRYAYDYADLERLPELTVLPSSSAARLALNGYAGVSLTGVPTLAIGAATEAAARHHGAADVIRCPVDSIESIVSSAIGMFAASGAYKRTAPRQADSACAKPAADAHNHDDSLNNHDSL